MRNQENLKNRFFEYLEKSGSLPPVAEDAPEAEFSEDDLDLELEPEAELEPEPEISRSDFIQALRRAS